MIRKEFGAGLHDAKTRSVRAGDLLERDERFEALNGQLRADHDQRDNPEHGDETHCSTNGVHMTRL